MKSAIQNLLGRVGYRLVHVKPNLKKLQRAPDGTIRATLWGREMVMGSDHHLPRILDNCPRFSEPIALLAQAMPQNKVRFVDIGANVGDTVAVVESYVPGKCAFLCIEPDAGFVGFCKANTANVKAVTILQALVDEGEGKSYTLAHHTPGTASTMRGSSDSALRSATLDSLAADFVSRNGGVDIIKVDTDGFDAKVLRSGKELLQAHKPMLFFEFHPHFWSQASEDGPSAFRYLQGLGYRHYVFFGNRGTVYAQINDPTALFLDTLTKVSASRRLIDDFHYDVLTGDPGTCRAVVDLSLKRTAETRML